MPQKSRIVLCLTRPIKQMIWGTVGHDNHFHWQTAALFRTWCISSKIAESLLVIRGTKGGN